MKKRRKIKFNFMYKLNQNHDLIKKLFAYYTKYEFQVK